MTILSSFSGQLRIISSLSFLLLLTLTVRGQVSAVDSMGVNMGKQNWKAAIYWALKAAEAIPADKYWRYLNAAEFASRLQNADLTLEYLSYVVNSDIGTRASYTSKTFEWLHEDARWKSLMNKVSQAREQELQRRILASQPFRRLQEKLLKANQAELASMSQVSSTSELYKQLRQVRHQTNPQLSGQYQYAWQRINDSTEATYIIQLPPDFDYQKSYPLLVVLHGAIGRQPSFPAVPDSTTNFFGRAFMRKASEAGMIAVFPYSTRSYNWMMPDAGFGLVPGIIEEVKKMYNIDDSRVYVTGHSNGATGAFSYLIKQPILFAGFSGLNNRPEVRTGGTFLLNALNRSFYNVATDYDYYYPLEGHRTLQTLTNKLNIGWQNIAVTGQRTHDYLINVQDSATSRVYQNLFTDMLNRKRNPFQKNLYWECDDLMHGRIDWLEISQLDTQATPSSWHKPINFQVSGWRNVENPALIIDKTANAFAFPRRSGAVKAYFEDNVFTLKTSRVGAVTLYFSPEMINLSRPVRIIVNGITVYHKKVFMDRKFIWENFQKHHDRQAVWINSIRVDVPENAAKKK